MNNEKTLCVMDAQGRQHQLDGRTDVGISGMRISVSRILKAAERVAESEGWKTDRHWPFPLIRRVTMLIMHDMGYTDHAIAAALGCERSNVTTQRRITKYQIEGDFKAADTWNYYRLIIDRINNDQ